VRSAVENTGDRLKAFLSRRVPDLNLDDFSFDSEIVRTKFYANSDLVL
jgi:hypothetical protein